MTTLTKISPDCSYSASCPSVFKTDDSYVIVGKNVGVTEHPELEGRIGPDECAVDIPALVLEGAILGASANADQALVNRAPETGLGPDGLRSFAQAEHAEAHQREYERKPDGTLTAAGAINCLMDERDWAYEKWLEASASLSSAQKRIEELERRLEIDHVWECTGDNAELVRRELTPEERSQYPDGIDCRDASLVLHREQAKRQSARIESLEKALVPLAKAADSPSLDVGHAVARKAVKAEDCDRARELLTAKRPIELCQADAEQVEAHHRTQERPLQSTSEVETIREENKSLKNTLEAAMNVVEFYANPENYFAIGFLPDRPSGAFADDFSDDYGHDHMQGYRPGKMARAFMHKSDWSFGPLDFDPIDPEKLMAPSQIEEPKQSEGDDAELQAKSLPDTNNSTESTQ